LTHTVGICIPRILYSPPRTPPRVDQLFSNVSLMCYSCMPHMSYRLHYISTPNAFSAHTLLSSRPTLTRIVDCVVFYFPANTV